MRRDDLDPLPYTSEMPSLMSATGRIDAHSVIAHFLTDNKIMGAYLEFGVGHGRSAVAALRAYQRTRVCNIFHLFDSFEGLPQPEGVDSSSRQFHARDYAFSKEQVRDFLLQHDVWNESNIVLHKGWFETTVPAWTEQAIASGLNVAVVHMDMDYYSSCLTVLKSIGPLLHTGTVILFDDWNCFSASNNAGERRAVRDWLAMNPGIHLNPWFAYGWHGQVFFCDVNDSQ